MLWWQIELKEYKQARTELQIAKVKDDSPDVQRLEKLLFKRANMTLAPTASDFDLVEELGEGNFSKVFKAKHKYTQRVYAIKTIEKQKVEQLKRRHKNIHNEIMMEKNVLAKLSHPNIVKLFGTFHDVGSLYYLMEFCDGGELWDSLKLKDGSMCGLPHSIASYYVAEIMNALEHMHRMGIVHRDLKPENLMISSTGHIKLVDFGTAKDLVDTRLNGQEFVGTAEYMSPETIDTRYAGPEADLWALGCVMFQFYVGRSPFAAGSPYLSFLKIRRGHVSFPDAIPEEARDVIQRLLVADTAQRFFNATGVVRPSVFDVIGTKLKKGDDNDDDGEMSGSDAGSDEEGGSGGDEGERRKPKKDAEKQQASGPSFTLEDMAVYQYNALRELPYFQQVKERVQTMLLYASKDGEAAEVSLSELHKHPAVRIPALKELAVNATAFACSEVAELSRQADVDGVEPPAWVKSFDIKRVGLNSPLATMIKHNLRCRNLLHEPRVFRQFFDKQIEARALRADVSSREYIGLEHKHNHQWKEPFFFVQIADPQLGITAGFAEQDGQGGSTWEVEKENLRKAVSAINKLRPRFVVVSGDLTHASPPKSYYAAQVREVRRLMARVSETIPVLYVCGNHDVCDNPTRETLNGYLRNFGADYYGFWCGGLRGLVLNTSLWWHGPPELAQRAQEQMEWFEQEIEQAKLCAQHVVVFTHIPLFLHDGDEEEDPLWTIPIEIRRKLLRLMHHRKVQLVLAGHYHRNGGGIAFPKKAKPAAGQEKEADAENEAEEAKQERMSVGSSSSDEWSGVNEDDDCTGPEMVITNSLGYPLGDTPPGFRIVEVREMEVKHYYVELDKVPAQVNLQPESPDKH